MSKWKKLAEEKIFEHPRLALFSHTVQLPNGKQTDYLVYGNIRDFPTIIAIHENGKILVTEEHAYPYNGLLLQFPEGVPDEDETMLEAANRELLEETGLKAAQMQEIGTNLHEHRRTTRRQHVLVADGIEDGQKTAGDVEEGDIKKHWFTEAEVWKLIADGKIIQKNALAAWSIFQAWRKSS